jgi:hypothetical protein
VLNVLQFVYRADHIRLQVSDPKVVVSSSHVFEKE